MTAHPAGLVLPTPCGDMSAASGTLWLSGLPPRISEGALAAECAQHGRVERVVLPLSPDDQVAYVGFCDIMCA